MNEKDFQQTVTDLADSLGITWVHIPDARTVPSAKGLPDLFLIGTHHCAWRELKMPGKKPEGQQVAWKYRLKAAGQNYDVWYPSALDSGQVEKELQSLNRA